MFLKELSITKADGDVIRKIPFRLGLNLILDETPSGGGTETGNNVGKTTVLKLVDYCLGGKAKDIYSDPENAKNEYKLVKSYLLEHGVTISLTLKDDLEDQASQEVLVERNFLPRQKKIQRVNGSDLTDDEYEEALTSLLADGHYGRKPSFRQMISHNIRYADLSVNNTIKNVNRFTSDEEYEALYLFLLGCDFESGDRKQELKYKINLESNFKKRLESDQTKSAYETALALLDAEIEELDKAKESLGIKPDFESDLEVLNRVKYELNVSSSKVTELELRRELILEAEQDLESAVSSIDVQQLQQIYQQATSLVDGIQKTFEELNDFHNRMLASKQRFIRQDLPRVEQSLLVESANVQRLLKKETELSSIITRTESFGMLETLISELNVKHQKKGEFENVLNQLNKVDSKLNELTEELDSINEELFSDEFAHKIKSQLNKFNRYFSAVSSEVYGEQYALKVDEKVVKGRRTYEFTVFNTNFSSGKKQGEISCFDIAYTLFADGEGIPCMHFLLNDKKELVHDNQLSAITDLVNSKGIQFVISMLKDKLPEALNNSGYEILKLSQNDKLFKIE